MRMTLADIILHTKGVCIRSSASVDTSNAKPLCMVSIDSRRLEANSLFVCLAGKRTDGHDHAKNAVDNGATVILAERDPFDDGQSPYNRIPVILVSDIYKALGMLANAHRKVMQGQVIGITGTAGKTTVKELLWHVLQSVGKTAKNVQNFNNQIGLPLSILAADTDCDYWVLEVGISQPKDMNELGTILQPDKILIINVGDAHTEGLGDKGVAHYKASLIPFLTDKGEALICVDYPDLVREAKQFQKQTGITLLGFTANHESTLHDKNTIYAVQCKESNEQHFGQFHLTLGDESLITEVPLCAAFAENIIAVASMAHRLGIPAQHIAQSLQSANLPQQRFNHKQYNDWCVIDDSYNANPLSAKRSIEASLSLAKNTNLICVMGEMAELGAQTEKAHYTLGQQLALANHVFWIGKHYELIQEGLSNQNFTGTLVSCADTETFIQAFCDTKLSKGVILFKGSRANSIERFVEAFITHLQIQDCT